MLVCTTPTTLLAHANICGTAVRIRVFMLVFMLAFVLSTCSPHPGDPRDNDYLVLQYGEDGRTDESQPLPEYRLRFQPTGVSYMDDLSVPDRDKIRHIALLELTSLFDRHSLPLRVSRPPKRKATTSESKVLGVPLTTLLERDQERIPTAKCPVFMEEVMESAELNFKASSTAGTLVTQIPTCRGTSSYRNVYPKAVCMSNACIVTQSCVMHLTPSALASTARVQPACAP